MNSALVASWNLPFLIANNHSSLNSQITPNYREKIFYCWQSSPPFPSPSIFSIFVNQTLVSESDSPAPGQGTVKQNPSPPSSWQYQGQTYTYCDLPHRHFSAPSVLNGKEERHKYQRKDQKIKSVLPLLFPDEEIQSGSKSMIFLLCHASGRGCLPIPVLPILPGGLLPTGLRGGVVVWPPVSPKACDPTIPQLPPMTSERVARCIRDMFPKKIASIWGILAHGFLLDVLRAVTGFIGDVFAQGHSAHLPG